MPGSQRETANAEEEGVEFIWLTNPEAFHGDDNNNVTAVQAVKMRLGPPDSSGRQTAEPMENSSFKLDAGLVIKALGFEPEDLPVLFDEPELETTRWGTVKIGFKDMMTSIPGVFAAGDIARGASLVVWAVKDGRDAAERIHDHIEARKQAAA
jgi:glutamate synthase (NADPH/NADH) small chain